MNLKKLDRDRQKNTFFEVPFLSRKKQTKKHWITKNQKKEREREKEKKKESKERNKKSKERKRERNKKTKNQNDERERKKKKKRRSELSLLLKIHKRQRSGVPTSKILTSKNSKYLCRKRE